VPIVTHSRAPSRGKNLRYDIDLDAHPHHPRHEHAVRLRATVGPVPDPAVPLPAPRPRLTPGGEQPGPRHAIRHALQPGPITIQKILRPVQDRPGVGGAAYDGG